MLFRGKSTAPKPTRIMVRMNRVGRVKDFWIEMRLERPVDIENANIVSDWVWDRVRPHMPSDNFEVHMNIDTRVIKVTRDNAVIADGFYGTRLMI